MSSELNPWPLIEIVLDGELHAASIIRELTNVLAAHPGNQQVRMLIKTSVGDVYAESPWTIDPYDHELWDQLHDLAGYENVNWVVLS